MDSNRTVLSNDHWRTISIAASTQRAINILVRAVDGVSGLVLGRYYSQCLINRLGER
jgi:hypothetical protein